MFLHTKKMLAALVVSSFLMPAAFAANDAPVVTVTPQVGGAYENMLKQPAINKALADLKADDARALAELKTITVIPAPPFKEAERAAYVLNRFKELGLKDAYIDKEGNVIGLRPGSAKGGPMLVLAAHLDTVFPAGTDLTIKERDGKLFAPGISDNTRGVATLLSVIKAVNENELKTVGDIMFVANVGEEGEGDLRGVKALFRDHKNIAGFISIDSGSLENVINQATGSHRYEVIFTGPGGHSFGAFGKVPSAIHAMGRAIAKIGDMQVPADPRTTFTVGTVTGGTSVNSIAGEARMKLDLRSNDMAALLDMEKKAIAAINAGVEEENARWQSEGKITVELKPIGDRPAGTTAADSLIMQAEAASLQALGMDVKKLVAASTDSNVAMSLGVPSLTIAKGGQAGGAHALEEWYMHKDAYMAAQNALLLTMGLVGMEGVSEPLLKPRGQ
ncbi:MAG: M20/M25/M40 family metallo-hydrolase [Saezia sp.]